MFANDVPKHLTDPVRFCTCTKDDCQCGETNIHEWHWDEVQKTPSSKLSKNNLEVKFNPGYSTGTAVVRGNKMLEQGKHYFWEIKMVTIPYGTDVMIGVGTSKVDLSYPTITYCSLLGNDKESWGLSFLGYIQNGGEKHYGHVHFGQGTLIAIHLDTWRGVLRYFINRKPIDMIFTGLRGIDLYPMACSTVADSIMRLTYSYSTDASLQMECLAILKPSVRERLSSAYAGLRYLSEGIFADMLNKEMVTVSDEEDIDDDDDLNPTRFTILDDFDFALVGMKKRRKRQIVRQTSVAIARK